MHDFSPKREWPDGRERICDGSNIKFGRGCHEMTSVNETPSEVYEIMKEAKKEYESLLELHHHADPAVPVYIDQREILVIAPRFSKVEDNE